MYIPDRTPKLPYFSPFETGWKNKRKNKDWRWYHKFITDYKEQGMNIRIESDMWDCLIQHGTLTC